MVCRLQQTNTQTVQQEINIKALVFCVSLIDFVLFFSIMLNTGQIVIEHSADCLLNEKLKVRK